MNNEVFQKSLIQQIEKKLSIHIIDSQISPQGMSSSVFFVVSDTGKEYAVKYGVDAMKDVPAFKLLKKEKIDIPVPELYASFIFESIPVVVLGKVPFPLLEAVPVREVSRYIPSMIENLRKLHTVRSTSPGFICSPEVKMGWQEMLLHIFDGGEFNWKEVSHREEIETDLLLFSVKNIQKKIKESVPEYDSYSFLHTDFNQRNIFIDPKSDQVTGIIDWEEAMFGDPLYDFARVRVYIWHFDLGETVVQRYYEQMAYTPEQRKLEDMYWLSRVIQYLGWYSEELTEFNRGRIRLHQDFLRRYNWE